MSKLLNIVAFTGCCIICIFLAWLMVDRLGADNVRVGLRYAFAPAVVLAGFAFTMLGKLHDLTEIGNLPVRVIERLIERVSIVQLRLWLLISAVTLATVAGWIISTIAESYAANHHWPIAATILCLAVLFVATCIAALYLPALHRDYTSFRMRAVRDFSDGEARKAALAELRR